MNALKSGMLTASLLSAFALSATAQQRVVDADAVAVAPPATEHTGYYKASDLIGMEVRGTDNQELGEVQDMFVDRTTNEIEYLILDTGVFADLDGKQPVIPWAIVNMQPGADANTYFLSLPLTQERIKTAPTIVLTDVDLFRSLAWVTQVDEFYAGELRERRVSRPDRDRDRVTSRQNRDTDRNDANRPQRRSNAGNATDAGDKPETPAQPKTDKPTKPRAESSATPDARPTPDKKPNPAPAPEKTEQP